MRQRKYKKQEASFIYMIKDKVTGLYKVEESMNVPKRIYNISKNYPNAIELFHSFYSENGRETEKLLLRLYRSKGLGREWFRLDVKDLRDMKNYKFPAVLKRSHRGLIKQRSILFCSKLFLSATTTAP
jgi:hypothetical protein